ncbi:MAG: peptidoglycan-binding protein [Roseiarcus sp.]
MPEALARSRNDSLLSRPARRAVRKGADGAVASLLRPLLSRPARTIAGAALAAILAGIVVNALVMQNEKRVAPSYAAPSPAATEVERPPPAPAAGVDAAPAVVQPPIRPAGLGGATPLSPARGGDPIRDLLRGDDPIRDLLRGDAARDGAHLTLAAQNALVKLGFPIKPDGVAGASTLQAIAQFERAHGMTASGAITLRLVQRLNAAANAAAR